MVPQMVTNSEEGSSISYVCPSVQSEQLINLPNEPLSTNTLKMSPNSYTVLFMDIKNTSNLLRSKIIHHEDRSYCQLENVQDNWFLDRIPYGEEVQRKNTDEGLVVSQMVCNHCADNIFDEYAFTGTEKLMEMPFAKTRTDQNSEEIKIVPMCIINKVVFGGCYKTEGDEAVKKEMEIKTKPKAKTRNILNKPTRKIPVREVRHKSMNLSKYYSLKKDLVVLDTSKEDKWQEEREIKATPKSSSTTRQRPIKAHRHLENNTKTKQIKASDRTTRIGEIRNPVPPTKKPKIETVPTLKQSKAKTTFCSRKGKASAVIRSRAPIATLKRLVNSTTDLLSQYLESKKEVNKCRRSTAGNRYVITKKMLEVFKYQTSLYSIINNVDEKIVLEKYKGFS